MYNIKKASVFWFDLLYTQDISVGILARPRNGQPKKHSSIPDSTTDFYLLLFKASRPAGGTISELTIKFANFIIRAVYISVSLNSRIMWQFKCDKM
jgi:hypothetical protein